MESQDQATAPNLQTRRARREAALAALDSISSGPSSQVAHGAPRTPSPHAAQTRPDGSVPPALTVLRAQAPVTPLRPAAANVRPSGAAPHASLGRAERPSAMGMAPHASSPSVVADPAALARLAAFSEIAELRRASEVRARSQAPAAHAAAARTAPLVVSQKSVDEVPAALAVREQLAAPVVVAPAEQVVLPAVPPAPEAAAPTVEPTHVAGCAPASRRAAVDARRAAAGKKPRAAGASFQRPSARPHKGGWVARAGILAALGVTTIAVPLANAVEGGEVPISSIPVVAEGRSTLEVITTSASSAAATEAVIIAEGSTLAAREASIASRGAARDTLAGCDLSADVTSANGRLSADELCKLPQSGHQLQPFAAVAFDALNEAYRAKFGADICLSDSYRTLQGQHSVARSKPGLSARPGTSQHGLGLAVDLCPTSYKSTARWNWLKANGPTYGWDNPAWARAGGSGKYEPWHWEYFPLVEY